MAKMWTVVIAVLALCVIGAEAKGRKCPKENLGPILTQLIQLVNTQDSLEQALDESRREAQATREDLDNLQGQVDAMTSAMGGSTYVRWGRKTCAGNAALVYHGLAGGKHYNQKGSGTNRLCVTKTPQFDNAALPPFYGDLYGAEYEHILDLQNKEVPCAVCRVPLATTIMVPGTLTCPDGWTSQYTGHLASAHINHYADEYACLDDNPEPESGVVTNSDGSLFYRVIAQCGSLPCPPYVQSKVVTCSVCSK